MLATVEKLPQLNSVDHYLWQNTRHLLDKRQKVKMPWTSIKLTKSDDNHINNSFITQTKKGLMAQLKQVELRVAKILDLSPVGTFCIFLLAANGKS